MIKVTVTKNEFANLARSLPVGVTAAVQGSAKRISAGAKQRARRGTGAMAGGFYTRHDGPTRSHVSNSVFYWRFHEYGTRKMAAHPMVHPAVEAERAAFYAAVARALQPGSFSVPMF